MVPPATGMIVMSVAVLTALVGCQAPAAPAPPASPAPSTSPQAPLPLPTRTFAPASGSGYSNYSGPATAELGVAYPYSLNMHCGARYVRFASRTWRRVEPGDLMPVFPRNARVDLEPDNPEVARGTMALLETDKARFRFSGRGVPPDTGLTYVPATDPTDPPKPPLCR